MSATLDFSFMQLIIKTMCWRIIMPCVVWIRAFENSLSARNILCESKKSFRVKCFFSCFYFSFARHRIMIVKCKRKKKKKEWILGGGNWVLMKIKHQNSFLKKETKVKLPKWQLKWEFTAFFNSRKFYFFAPQKMIYKMISLLQHVPYNL